MVHLYVYDNPGTPYLVKNLAHSYFTLRRIYLMTVAKSFSTLGLRRFVKATGKF